MAAVGVIGLGAMGLPIAGHLVRAGLAVAVHDPDADRVAAAAGEGCTVAANPAEVAGSSARVVDAALTGGVTAAERGTVTVCRSRPSGRRSRTGPPTAARCARWSGSA
jgi:3-hydroxyisobutyrate dehydrogenase-like beta-hydroxyacid dehydrogenase